jgi:hypothetical protein
VAGVSNTLRRPSTSLAGFLEGCLRPIGHRLQPDADYRKELGSWHSFDRADDEAGRIAFAAAVVI